MNDKRKPMSGKLRFEILKRDKFTCQYCGVTATEKLLHIDHIKPVADGGDNNPLNLTTSCRECNLGKGARPLSDNGFLKSQHKQLAEMEDRRQQLELMRQWREELENHAVSEVDIVADAISARSEWAPNDKGRNDLRRLIKKHGIAEVLTAADESFDLYFRDGTQADWNKAFRKIGLVISMRHQEKEDPNIRKVLYIQGILRKRIDASENYADSLKTCISKGYPVGILEEKAKRADSWSHFVSLLNEWSAARRTEAPKIDHAKILEEETALARQHRDICIDGLPFGERYRDILRMLNAHTGSTGWFPVGDEVPESAVTILRALQAVGLVVPGHDDDIMYRDENGRYCASFDLNLPDREDPSGYFNRFGGIRLSTFFGERMSRVANIYG